MVTRVTLTRSNSTGQKLFQNFLNQNPILGSMGCKRLIFIAIQEKYLITNLATIQPRRLPIRRLVSAAMGRISARPPSSLLASEMGQAKRPPSQISTVGSADPLPALGWGRGTFGNTGDEAGLSHGTWPQQVHNPMSSQVQIRPTCR
jgi:hypothetical protein